MRVAFFEDRGAANFTPVALTRPVFELICGQFSLRERVLRQLGVTELGAFLRNYLAGTYRASEPEAHVNDILWLSRERTLVLNGRWIPTASALAALKSDEAAVVDGTVVALTLDPMEVPLITEDNWDDILPQIARSRKIVQARGVLLNYPWDLIEHNAAQLIRDFQLQRFSPSQNEIGPEVAIQGPRADVWVDPTAVLDPFVVLDARRGPIAIDAGAVIQPFTRLEGPCYVGKGSQLFRANVREGTTIGPVCRVGGEVECSILHGYVNKYHEGFLGHSYVCPWVNIAALSTSSDLKSDYSPVSVPLAGEMIPTGRMKVGCFIGDHTKTTLASLFNTGSSIGIMSLLVNGGEMMPKHVPSFSCVKGARSIDEWSLERALHTARTAMDRRRVQMSAAEEKLYRYLFDRTRTERTDAFRRHRERASQHH